jgi:hypothetical protein
LRREAWIIIDLGFSLKIQEKTVRDSGKIEKKKKKKKNKKKNKKKKNKKKKKNTKLRIKENKTKKDSFLHLSQVPFE